jgi:hypothetical protein
MRCALGRHGFHRKRGADVGSRVHNEAAVGRPRRIDAVILDKTSGGSTVDRQTEEVRDAVLGHRQGDRLAVRRGQRHGEPKIPAACPRVQLRSLHLVMYTGGSGRQSTAFHGKVKELPQFCSLPFDGYHQDVRLCPYVSIRGRKRDKETEYETQITLVGVV